MSAIGHVQPAGLLVPNEYNNKCAVRRLSRLSRGLQSCSQTLSAFVKGLDCHDKSNNSLPYPNFCSINCSNSPLGPNAGPHRHDLHTIIPPKVCRACAHWPMLCHKYNQSVYTCPIQLSVLRLI